MPLNKDGLEPGQLVDFETIQKVNRQRREDQKNAESEPRRKPAKSASKRVKAHEQSDSEEPKEAE